MQMSGDLQEQVERRGFTDTSVVGGGEIDPAYIRGEEIQFNHDQEQNVPLYANEMTLPLRENVFQ
jgi:hypothetical protein